eukprot:4383825-Prymnesium_polylepis.1
MLASLADTVAASTKPFALALFVPYDDAERWRRLQPAGLLRYYPVKAFYGTQAIYYSAAAAQIAEAHFKRFMDGFVGLGDMLLKSLVAGCDFDPLWRPNVTGPDCRFDVSRSQVALYATPFSLAQHVSTTSATRELNVTYRAGNFLEHRAWRGPHRSDQAALATLMWRCPRWSKDDAYHRPREAWHQLMANGPLS